MKRCKILAAAAIGVSTLSSVEIAVAQQPLSSEASELKSILQLQVQLLSRIETRLQNLEDKLPPVKPPKNPTVVELTVKECVNMGGVVDASNKECLGKGYFTCVTYDLNANRYENCIDEGFAQ
jgi:hypothetical protein